MVFHADGKSDYDVIHSMAVMYITL